MCIVPPPPPPPECSRDNRVRVMVFNATFNNISVISWQGRHNMTNCKFNIL